MNKAVLNIVFLAVCGAILFFLLKAPEKSTAPLPHDENHQVFFQMDKKEAEKSCLNCHGDNEIKPLAPDHPSKHRCLLCHTKDK